MSLARVVPPVMSKEIRALLPTWLACTGAIGASAMIADARITVVGVLAYALGSVALGAQSIGHEYSHRTLSLLLSQPVNRRRLLLLKLGVLASMLLTLSGVAWIVLIEGGAFTQPSRAPERSLLAAAAVSGLFVAPWLTMLCRSTLAGMVLTITIPLTLMLLGDIIGVARYGFGGGAPIDRFKIAALWWGMLVVCTAAAVSSWRMFARLEAIDGRGSDLHLPRWSRRRSQPSTEALGVGSVRVSNPVWLLAKKELRLQQMTFVIVGVYLLTWASLSTLAYYVPDLRTIPLGPLTVLYFALLSLLIGSLASAEERQLGTLEWQVLLPMATSKQWIVKGGMTLGLAVVLGIGLQALLWRINPFMFDRVPASGWREAAIVIVLLTTCSLYLSTLCTSGVRAMVLSLPIVLGGIIFTQTVALAVFRTFVYPSLRSGGGRWLRTESFHSVMLATIVVFIAVLLRFSLVNHRSAERNARRVWGQVIWILGFLTVVGAVSAVRFR